MELERRNRPKVERALNDVHKPPTKGGYQAFHAIC